MESKKAYLQLLEISKDQKFEVLVDYLLKSDPVNLNTSIVEFRALFSISCSQPATFNQSSKNYMEQGYAIAF